MFLQNLTNGLLFIYFLFITIVAPLFDGQTILPIEFFPKLLIDLKSNYAQENNDYLISEKPHFFVGLVWVELLLQWPLCMAKNCYQPSIFIFFIEIFSFFHHFISILICNACHSTFKFFTTPSA
ncbi:hypothetical protein MKW94_030628 [Papaver nudicaule]|uniref:EXPERA domain-containing protein n=1 Tax=Papaver nudicaule TaxID=74823 RepID=A0AA41VVN7_PAPNU|nr:hypothetical protein [Papaver nudicaule]